LTPDILKQILAAKAARQAIAVITDVRTGRQEVVRRAELGNHALADALDKAFRFDKSGMVGEQFVAIHNPPLRLIIIGAVLIAQSVIPIAQTCGFDVAVIDPRGAFATGARFPNVSLHAEWPQDILPKLGFDARTGFMALTHDPKIDDPALDLALRSEVFYIGALGSKKTQGTRRERMLAAGFDEAALARIRGPIGLNIGAVGAAEIAVSVMAEMLKALRLGFE
jgi:xanthine dehydrogenase accessory factor